MHTQLSMRGKENGYISGTNNTNDNPKGNSLSTVRLYCCLIPNTYLFPPKHDQRMVKRQATDVMADF